MTDRESLDAAYRTTDYVVATPHGEVTLRADAPATGDPAALALVAGRRITVVTAHNPRSGVQSEAANRAANDRLRADLQAREWRFWDAVGQARTGPGNVAATGRWSEDSFAVLDADPADVRDLARAHGQNAVFAWDGARGDVAWCEA